MPALAGHSMTMVNDSVVVIIGGMTSSSQYLHTVYFLEVGAGEVILTPLSNVTGAQPLGESLLCAKLE